jgi:hypothetical protein
MGTTRASTWSTNPTMKNDCKANKEDKIDCDDDYNGRLDPKNKRMEKSRSKTYKRW